MITQLNETTQLMAALDYQSRGWAVIPVWAAEECMDGLCTYAPNCTDVGKHARVKWKSIKTTSEGAVRGWWRNWPNANIGALTGRRSGFDVIDVDPKNGGSYGALKDKFLDMPEPHVCTGGGGQHIYINHPLTPEDHEKGVRTSSSLNKVFGLPGIDYRGDGNYIIAPPSGHEFGTRYEWISDPAGELPMMRDAAVGEWGEEERKAKKKTSKKTPKKMPKKMPKKKDKPTGRSTEYGLSKLALAQAKMRTAAVNETGRHDELLRMARLLGGCIPEHLTEDKAFDGLRKTALEVMGEERESEIERTINDGLDAGMDEPLEEEEEETDDELLDMPTFEDVPLVNTKWLWEQRIPLGVLSTIAGDGDRGKSTLSLLLAAKVTRGELEGDLYGKPQRVLISTVEDGKRVIAPRLRAAGADMSMVRTLSAAGPMQFPQDAERLSRKLTASGAVLLIIDPFLGHFGGNDSHKETDVRAALNPLVKLAEDFDVAVVGLQHFNKGNGSATQRLSGSTAWRNIVRSVLICERAPETVTEGDYVVAPEKSNLAKGRPPALAYNIVDTVAGQDADGVNVGVGVAQFRGEVDVDVNELLAARPRPKKQDAAKDWLREMLQPGPVTVSAVVESGTNRNHSRRTLERARNELGVSSTKHTDHWDWSLPGSAAVCDEEDEFPAPTLRKRRVRR